MARLWVAAAFILGGGVGFAVETLPTVTATPTSLSFSYQIGTPTLPAAQTVQVKRVGAGVALDFSVTIPPSAPWLIVTPTTGKTGTALSVRVNTTSLLAGSYTTTVQLDVPAAAGPATFNVTLLVKNPPPTMSASPTSLTFTYETDQAQAPAAQPVTVSTNGEPVSFTAVAAGGTWLVAEPALGIAVAGSPVSLAVSVVTDGLLPGTYNGRLTVNSANAANKSILIGVSLTVTAGAAVITSIWPNAAPLGSDDCTITIRGRHFFRSSVVDAGAATLATTWVSTTVVLAVIPKASLATQGALSVTVTNSPKPASAPATFTVTAPGPQIQTVANAASFASDPQAPVISPGEIISIFGSGLGPATLQEAVPSGGAFPTSVGSPPTLVEFELTAGVWTPAPIIFAQANQINAVAPFALTAAPNLRMRVTYNSLNSTPVVFTGVTANPGIFTTDSSGRGQAAALNYNATTRAYSLNGASNPAPKGSTVIIFLTGGGTIAPAPSPEGQIIPVGAPAPTLSAAVSVTIGGDGAVVQSATAVPGSIAGLVQLNLTVPSAVKAAKDLPMVVTIAGRSSPATAAIAVK